VAKFSSRHVILPRIGIQSMLAVSSTLEAPMSFVSRPVAWQWTNAPADGYPGRAGSDHIGSPPPKAWPQTLASGHGWPPKAAFGGDASSLRLGYLFAGPLAPRLSSGRARPSPCLIKLDSPAPQGTAAGSAPLRMHARAAHQPLTLKSWSAQRWLVVWHANRGRVSRPSDFISAYAG